MGSRKITGIYVELRADPRQLKADLDNAKGLVKSAAGNMSDAMGGAMTATSLRRNLSSLVTDLSQLERSSKTGTDAFKHIGFAASDLGARLNLPEKQFAMLQSRMLQNQAAETQISALRRIGQQAGLTATEIRKLGQDMGVSKENIAKATGGGGSTLAVGLGAAAAVAAVATVAFTAGKASFDANINAQKLAASYKTIEGSAVGANQQLLYLRGESERLGTQYQESAAAAKTFFAAGKGTALEGQMRGIYSAVTEAGTALSLSQDELSGIFLALGQMISKGKVQAEELRGQLGERLPGAFGLAAKAMGVTTGELDKMLESGTVLAEDLLPKLSDAMHNKFGKAALEAAKGGAQEVNRMSTEWTDLKANILDSGPAISAIQLITGHLKRSNDELIRQKMVSAGIKGDVQANGDSYEISYTEAQIRAYKEYGTTVTEEINRVEQAKQRAAREEYAAASVERAIGKASSTSKAFLTDTPAAKRSKITEESEAAIKAQEDARAKDIENATRYDARIVQIKSETARKLAAIDKSANAPDDKRRTALESITVELSKANDIYGEGEGALAALERKQTEYTKALGVSNPKVKQHGELVAFVREHMGKTPAEIAKVNLALEDQIDLLNEEIYARQAVAHLYGSDQSDELQMLQARTNARKAYKKALDDGADKTTAGQVQLLTVANEQDKIDQRKEGAARSVAVNFAGSAYDEQRKNITATYELAKNSTTDQVALERAKNEQLSELEEKRLQATGRAQDGMTAALKKYAREAGNDGANMFDLWTSSIKSTEDALVSMATTGEINVTSMLKSIQAEMTRMIVVRPLLSGLTGAVESGALFSGLKGMFASIFHEGGTSGVTPAPVRLVSPEVFAGAPRYHNGLQSGERAAIIQDGEDVLSVVQKARLSNIKASSGASVTMPVTIINNASNTVQASARQVTNAQGGKSLEVQVDELMARKLNQPGSASGRALRSTFGASRVMTQRS